jgi:N-acetylglucosaminyldiphosphoundecaprenol N-acetyl-beta-D-mannosaminyltransferase
MGIVWGARLLGLHIAERVTGVDLMLHLLDLCDREQFRPYILGAEPAVLEKAIEAIRRRCPNIQFAGYHHGYFSDAQSGQIAAAISACKPDMLFIAMPTPRKENFMHQYRDGIDAPYMMGVGGTVDVIAGVVNRAPKWIQALGLEWAFRTLQEPKRMWRRYWETNTAFAVLMMKALVSARDASQNSTSP